MVGSGFLARQSSFLSAIFCVFIWCIFLIIDIYYKSILATDIELKDLVGQEKSMETSEHHVWLTIWSPRLKRFVKHVLREVEYWTGKSRNKRRKDHRDSAQVTFMVPSPWNPHTWESINRTKAAFKLQEDLTIKCYYWSISLEGIASTTNPNIFMEILFLTMYRNLSKRSCGR